MLTKLRMKRIRKFKSYEIFQITVLSLFVPLSSVTKLNKNMEQYHKPFELHILG